MLNNPLVDTTVFMTLDFLLGLLFDKVAIYGGCVQDLFNKDRQL